MTTVLRVVSLLALLVGLAPSTFAAPPSYTADYIVDFWQEDSGLPQRYVYVVHQTRDGYLWIGTRGGLARFDGVTFTVFDDRDPQQLRESEVMALTEDREGGLWVGTHGGGVSVLRKGKFTTYSVPEGLPNEFVGALATGKDGSVWIGTEKGLVQFSHDRFTVFGVKDGLPGDDVRSLYADADGVVWVGTQKGLASVGPEGRIVAYGERDARLQGSVLSIIGDGRGGLWVGTGNAGVLQFKEGVLQQLDTTSGLDSNTIAALTVDAEGTLWIATWERLFRARDGRVERFVGQVTRVSGNHTVQTSSFRALEALFTDAEGSVWVGMGTEGLARLRPAVFRNVSVGERDGREERVASTFVDRGGTVWLGRSGGVVRVENGVVSRLDLPGAVGDSVNTIFEDAAGVVCVVSRSGLFRSASGRLVRAAETGGVDGAPRMDIVVSLVTRDGTIWLGDVQHGLFQYREGRFTRYARELPGARIRALAEDRAGGIWVGTKDGGLARLFGDRVETYSVEQGLPSAAVSALHVDEDDTVWVATRRGLARIRNGQVRAFSAGHGLPVNYYYQVVEDDLGNLWMSSGRGIVRVSRQELNDVADGKAEVVAPRLFGTESGMNTTFMIVPNQPAAYKGRDGLLWFATGSGAAVVDPAAIVKNQVPPPVWVEEVRVDKVAHAPAAGLTFAAGLGELEVAYAGLSFIAPERVQFRYMLEGFDTRWVEARTRRVAYYTNLPPGPYVFRVRARNSDGVWNEAGDAVSFVLLPHWYQRRSTHVAGAILVCALLVGAYKWRVREHKRQAVELARKVEEAVGQVKMLRGMLPICAGCKKIRDDTGYWNQMETYISNHSEADFSHGMCPECLERLYPEYAAAQRAASSS